MLKINFFGDFKCDDVTKLAFSATMKALLREADMNVLNFEAPVRVDNPCPLKKNSPCLSQDPAAPAFLKANRFSIVNLANDHIADCGPEALLATVDSFEHSCGAGTWFKAYEPEVLKVHGYKVAFIGVTHNCLGVLADQKSSEDSLGAAWMLHTCIDEKIVQARKDCDLVFVMAHAGMQFEDMPLPEIRSLYRHWVDIGADAVIGSHPHVPQPWESYNGKPIFYSLGNFCYDTEPDKAERYWYIGVAACLTVDNRGKVEARSVTCAYDQKYRYISNVTGDGDFRDHLDDMMVTLFDDESYMKIVDDMCLRHADDLEESIIQAGYQKMSTRNFLRWKFHKKAAADLSSLSEDFSCESRRWAIERALAIKAKSQR